ncbi:MAG: hypothetical protein ABSC25_10550 [Roseiarcus sp.]|jgi:uncharacterized protein (DUF1778 family)
MAATSAKRDTLNIRIRPAERGLINQVAPSFGESGVDFILDAAPLDATRQADERLRRTMRAPAAWVPA